MKKIQGPGRDRETEPAQPVQPKAKHTVRGFMAGAMKKAGFTVESFKPDGGERTYRINK